MKEILTEKLETNEKAKKLGQLILGGFAAVALVSIAILVMLAVKNKKKIRRNNSTK